ncbi:Growth-regulating factor-like protein [Quillaja saponaria]|uniref:Growth-regulating factor n=1 Tax=Quillaja saponaria TaxID=32244 RepID=A0AAD7LDE0_QUISA|nr:Growth-regulating factor-like protein [Quillaja saponaria]
MSGRSRFPFTASQWQELEHQALIFKYMASGIPIPPDLLFSINRNTLDSSLSSRISSHQPQHLGWNYLQMGLGRKIDPEPGRCRRTDGKKWRCSKEAYPDSKYCERHMHRGKNRSRKPVEILKTTPTNTNLSTPTTVSSNTKNSSALTPTNYSISPLSSISSEINHRPQHSCSSSHLQYPSFLYTHSSSRPCGIGFSCQDNSSPLFQDTGSYSQTNTDYRNRYVYGLKEEADEHAFFSEPSGTRRSFSPSSMDESWQFTPLTISSSSSKQRSCSGLQNEYSYLQLQSINDDNTIKQPEQDQRCYVMGSDIKSEMPIKLGKEEPQKTVHRFFDEWPPESRDSWLDLDDKSSNASSTSTTRLSISIPTPSHDFPTFNNRTHHDG